MIDDVKRFVEYVSNKDQSGNTTSPEEFNVLARRASLDLFKKRAGLPEDYQVGAPLSKQAWQLTQTITDDLRFLIEEKVIEVDSDGYMIVPDDYVRYSSIDFNYILNPKTREEGQTSFPVPVEVIDDNKWSRRISSSLKPTSKRYPVCRYRNVNIEFSPKNLERVIFTYLRVPADPVWGFDVVNDAEVYNESKSTQFDWPVETEIDLASYILSYVGVNLDDDHITKYAEIIKSKGV